ncbi:alpha/beta hydrolase-fold protein [Psychrobacillus sp. NEAU-3TGS]|uniref:alpha/beta hydrolase n=1 Tax=Psychrobacillus sp. NEAU-3TGS TaxID=2995412 RepID=UPI002498B8DE|nr:alpha/beta hydrolase-fold protein [Psychrobacillus sp. NEAU-3TGS]MDI2587641.1 alpha/beta hydrolase-fold protein [Psychrobacillus sp. NEAU-3TGS]
MNKCNRTFYSAYLKKTLDYMVVTTSENMEDAYVLYVQDGKDYLELGGLEKAIQDVVHLYPELANHLVFVLIHPGDSMERWESFSRKGASFHDYLRFMSDEFIPEIERNLGVAKISKRGLLGDSLAGNISLNIALEKPEIWTHILLQSPAISDGDIKRLEALDLPTWNVYQTVGIYEDEFVSAISKEKLYILTRNRQLYKSFLSKNVNVHYVESEDDHLWKVWERDLPAALHFFVKEV